MSPQQTFGNTFEPLQLRELRKAKKMDQIPQERLVEEFNKILLHKDISIHFQPIVSLSQGIIFGYEALTRGPENSYFYQPNTLFQFAEAEGLMYSLEKMAREQAVQRAQHLSQENKKIFININAQVIYDPDFTSENITNLIHSYGLSPQNIVFEITERSSIRDFIVFKNVLDSFRLLGYQFAIDDAGAGYSSLQAISELKPDFIKVDRSLIQGIDQNKVKENLLETFVNLARRMNSKIIAEGIETIEELVKVTRLGVHFGQGFLIARPTFLPSNISNEALACIQKHKRIGNLDLTNRMSISEITSSIQTVDIETSVSQVSDYLSNSPWELGLVITKNNRPVGLVMKEKLNQELAKPFGISLYSKKSIESLMDPNPLIVDHTTAIDIVAQLAITRDQRTLYDFIIVVENRNLLGIVSIQDILEFLANVKMEIVRNANPLTGLPGNQQINLEISNRIREQVAFALIYADIDNFKWYNDLFGFQQGDQVIKHVGEIMLEVIAQIGSSGDFIGHIGGDDFVIITYPDLAQNICQEIIARFQQEVHNFYDNPNDILTQITDRKGNIMHIYGISISLAVIECVETPYLNIDKLSKISAEVKKQSKAITGNSVVYHCIRK